MSKKPRHRYDPLSKEERSERMARVRGADTKPEILVRKLVHAMGYRYRLHVTDVPGKPDLVFRPRRKVIFVHGCFWHQHKCGKFRMPKTRLDFWRPKLEKNVARDRKVRALLRKDRWKMLVIWECELKNTKRLESRLRRFLENAE